MLHEIERMKRSNSNYYRNYRKLLPFNLICSCHLDTKIEIILKIKP